MSQKVTKNVTGCHMAKIGIRDAAKLVNKSYRTIYRHVAKGIVSAEKSADDSLVIDTSELIRVYGQITLPVTEVSQQSTQEMSQDVTALMMQKMEEMAAEIKGLKETLTTLTNRLEHKPEPEPEKPPKPKRTGNVTSIADILKHIEN